MDAPPHPEQSLVGVRLLAPSVVRRLACAASALLIACPSTPGAPPRSVTTAGGAALDSGPDTVDAPLDCADPRQAERPVEGAPWPILEAAHRALELPITEAGPARDTFTCGELARIRDLELDDVDSLAGVALLSGLERLSVQRIARDGLAPLAKSRRLRVLEIGSAITTFVPAPVVDLTPARGWRHLEVLAIRGASVRELAPIAGLAQLRELDLQSSQITSIDDLRALTALERLNLAYNGVRDLTPLRDLIRLEVLDLSSNPITDIAALGGLAALRELNLGHTQVESLEPLSRLAALESVYLTRTRVQDLRPLERLPRLHSVYACLTPAEIIQAWNAVNRHVVERLRRRGIMVVIRHNCRH